MISFPKANRFVENAGQFSGAFQFASENGKCAFGADFPVNQSKFR